MLFFLYRKIKKLDIIISIISAKIYPYAAPIMPNFGINIKYIVVAERETNTPTRGANFSRLKL